MHASQIATSDGCSILSFWVLFICLWKFIFSSKQTRVEGPGGRFCTIFFLSSQDEWEWSCNKMKYLGKFKYLPFLYFRYLLATEFEHEASRIRHLCTITYIAIAIMYLFWSFACAYKCPLDGIISCYMQTLIHAQDP